MTDALELARRYLAAVEGGATGDTLAAFYAPEVVQEEFPNRLFPLGARRDLSAILEAGARGQQVMAALASGDNVALEFRWVGTLAIPVGSLLAGGEMRGRCAVFLEFRDGRIVAQRSYDCFEPW
jgi:ketosteroid isomerase-like protein